MMKMIDYQVTINGIRVTASYSERAVNRIFLPSRGNIGRLVRRAPVSSTARIRITRKPASGETVALTAEFSNHAKGDAAAVTGLSRWYSPDTECVYIPVKDMLANAPGFCSLYERREVHIEEIYVDIIRRALVPALKGAAAKDRKNIEHILSKAISGKVTTKGEEFFLKNKQGDLEFTLLAEGLRKLGLIWLLLQNGTLLKGSILFWDEPEANLNPKLIHTVVEVLLAFQRMGVQIFLATHNYVILKELELQREEADCVQFYSLHKDQGTIKVSSSATLYELAPNAINDTFDDMLMRELTGQK